MPDAWRASSRENPAVGHVEIRVPYAGARGRKDGRRVQIQSVQLLNEAYVSLAVRALASSQGHAHAAARFCDEGCRAVALRQGSRSCKISQPDPGV